MSATAATSIHRKWTASVTRCALARILSEDLNFHQCASNYASHSVHSFAAKFPPQLPRVFIEGLTDPGETVLDPMMGSGTSVVEAFLCNRKAVGFDIDPQRLPGRANVYSRPLSNLPGAPFLWLAKVFAGGILDET